MNIAFGFPALVFLIVSLALRVASAPTADLSYFLLAIYALLGRIQVVQALALSWLFSMLNPSLVPDASLASADRYLVIVATVLSVVWRMKGRGVIFSIQRLSLLTLCMGLFILLHSFLFSSVVDVSVLKVMSWVTVVLTLLSAWQGLLFVQREALSNQLQHGLIMIVLLSLPLLIVPDVGYFRNGSGFQGVLSHPQSFGPTVALLGVLVGGRIMGSEKPAWRDMALLVTCFVLVVLSEARTAGVALVLGLLGSMLLSPMFAGLSLRRMLPGLRSRRLQAVILMISVAIFVASPLLVSKLSNFIFKRSETTSLVAAADASRGELVAKMLSNIQKYPLTGIGFGIASEPEYMEVERDPVLGLPLSAVVEKGVMPIALAEELGAIGALVVFGWFLVVLRRGARSGVSQFAVVITVLLVNLGESMFFSVGGMGMLLLIMLTAAVTSEQSTPRQVASHV